MAIETLKFFLFCKLRYRLTGGSKRLNNGFNRFFGQKNLRIDTQNAKNFSTPGPIQIKTLNWAKMAENGPKIGPVWGLSTFFQV